MLKGSANLIRVERTLLCAPHLLAKPLDGAPAAFVEGRRLGAPRDILQARDAEDDLTIGRPRNRPLGHERLRRRLVDLHRDRHVSTAADDDDFGVVLHPHLLDAKRAVVLRPAVAYVTQHELREVVLDSRSWSCSARPQTIGNDVNIVTLCTRLFGALPPSCLQGRRPAASGKQLGRTPSPGASIASKSIRMSVHKCGICKRQSRFNGYRPVARFRKRCGLVPEHVQKQPSRRELPGVA